MGNIVLFVVIQISFSKVVRGNEDPWAKNTINALKSLREVANLWDLCTSKPGHQRLLDCYLNELTDRLPQFEQFLIKSQLKEKAYNFEMSDLNRELERFERDTMARVETLFPSPRLKQTFTMTWRPLILALRRNVRRAQSSDPSAQNGYVLPLQDACFYLLERKFPALSVQVICPTLSKCSSSPLSGDTTANACGKDDKCDVDKAIPLMVGMLFYKVSFTFIDKFCDERCSGENGCNITEEFSSIAKQVQLMKAFTTMLPENPLDQFFRDALTEKAYSEIEKAMKIISQNEHNFDLHLSRLACEEIEAEPGCQLKRFYPHYLLLKKIKNERTDPLYPVDTRDLSLYDNVDDAKILELKQGAIKHTQLLNAIDKLNKNLEAKVNGISSYFEGVASFDEGVAKADVDFIRGKLKTFNTNYETLQGKVKQDTTKAMVAMTAILTTQLAGETVELVSKIAEESNPVAVIFTGIDASEILDQAGKVADSAAQLVHGVSLFANLSNLVTNTIELANDLIDNQNQIKTLKTLVDKITNNEADEIGEDAEVFIDEYSAYTPKVDRSRMARNIELWGAFQESTCDLLNGVETIRSSVLKGVENGFLLCENLQVTIAEFDALRENIFEFQFELVDSLARVVRGNLAKKLANSIDQQENDMIKADQLLDGFLMAQVVLQSQAWLYCDKVEYQNHGEKVRPCSPKIGLFSESDLDELIAYKDTQSHTTIERTVHIPSRPQYNGYVGFINVRALVQGKTTSFRLPRNETWLQEFQWGLTGESHPFYVENFQLFLLKKEYKSDDDAKVKTSTRVEVTADSEAGSYVSTNQNNSVLYKLPTQNSYVTAYEEGFRSSTCSNEVSNPYSLCNNLPNICLTSRNVAGTGLLPTIFSRWILTYSMQSGHQSVDWPAPNPATDLKFIAKVKLRMHSRKSTKKWQVEKIAHQSDLCCQGNTYRKSLVRNTCIECPNGSSSRLGGYYCEVDSIPRGGGKKHHVFHRKKCSKV